MIEFKPGDRFVVEAATALEEHTFYSPELLVRFLRTQRAGTSWIIRQFRLGEEIHNPSLIPMAVLDQFRGMY